MLWKYRYLNLIYSTGSYVFEKELSYADVHLPAVPEIHSIVVSTDHRSLADRIQNDKISTDLNVD